MQGYAEEEAGERYANGKGKKKRLSDVKGEEEEALLGFEGESVGLSGTDLSEVSWSFGKILRVNLECELTIGWSV